MVSGVATSKQGDDKSARGSKEATANEEVASPIRAERRRL
jgi:hypothetical protein